MLDALVEKWGGRGETKQNRQVNGEAKSWGLLATNEAARSNRFGLRGA